MKSDNVLVALSVVFLLLATTASVVVWSDVSTAAKVAFFAFGFATGVTTGARLARRRQSGR